jgi:hypothetical protein
MLLQVRNAKFDQLPLFMHSFLEELIVFIPHKIIEPSK